MAGSRGAETPMAARRAEGVAMSHFGFVSSQQLWLKHTSSAQSAKLHYSQNYVKIIVRDGLSAASGDT